MKGFDYLIDWTRTFRVGRLSVSLTTGRWMRPYIRAGRSSLYSLWVTVETGFMEIAFAWRLRYGD